MNDNSFLDLYQSSAADAPFGSSVSNSISASLHLISSQISASAPTTTANINNNSNSSSDIAKLEQSLRHLLTRVENLPIFPSAKDSSLMRKSLREDFERNVRPQIRSLKTGYQQFIHDEKEFVREKMSDHQQNGASNTSTRNSPGQERKVHFDSPKVGERTSPTLTTRSPSRDRIKRNDDDDDDDLKLTPNDADDVEENRQKKTDSNTEEETDSNNENKMSATSRWQGVANALRYVKSLGNFHEDEQHTSSIGAAANRPASDQRPQSPRVSSPKLTTTALKNLETQLRKRKSNLQQAKNCFKFEASFRLFLWTVQLARSYLAILAPIYYEITDLKSHWLKVVSKPSSFFLRWLVVDTFTATRSWFHMGYLPILHTALDHVQNLQKMEHELVETIGRLHVALQGALFRVEEVAAQSDELTDALVVVAECGTSNNLPEQNDRQDTVQNSFNTKPSARGVADGDALDIADNQNNTPINEQVESDEEQDDEEDLALDDQEDILLTELHRASITVIRHMHDTMEKLRETCDNFYTASSSSPSSSPVNTNSGTSSSSSNTKNPSSPTTTTQQQKPKRNADDDAITNKNDFLIMTPILHPGNDDDDDDDGANKDDASSPHFPSLGSPAKPLRADSSSHDMLLMTQSSSPTLDTQNDPASKNHSPMSLFPRADAEHDRQVRESLERKNLMSANMDRSPSATVLLQSETDVFRNTSVANFQLPKTSSPPEKNTGTTNSRTPPHQQNANHHYQQPRTFASSNEQHQQNSKKSRLLTRHNDFVDASASFFNDFIRQHCDLLHQLQIISKSVDSHLEHIRSTLIRRARWSVRSRVLKTIGLSFLGCGVAGLIWMNSKSMTPPEYIDYYLKPIYKSFVANVRVYVMEPLVDLLSGLFSGPDQEGIQVVNDEGDKETYVKLVLDYHKDALQRDLAEARTMLALPGLDFGGISSGTVIGATKSEDNNNNNASSSSSTNPLDDPVIRDKLIDLLAVGTLQQQALENTGGEGMSLASSSGSPNELQTRDFDIFLDSQQQESANYHSVSNNEHQSQLPEINKQLTTTLLENKNIRQEVLDKVVASAQKTIDDQRVRNDYVASVRKPISGLIFGQLVRLLLIDLQRQKVGISQIMTQSDNMLRQQDLNFKIFAMMPVAMLVSGIMVIRSLTKKSVELPLRRELLASWRALHAVVTRSSRFSSTSSAGGNNNNDNNNLQPNATGSNPPSGTMSTTNLQQQQQQTFGTSSAAASSPNTGVIDVNSFGSGDPGSGLFANNAIVINTNNQRSNTTNNAKNQNRLVHGNTNHHRHQLQQNPFHVEMGSILLIVHRMKMLGRSLRRIKNEPIPPSQAWAIATARVASLIAKNKDEFHQNESSNHQQTSSSNEKDKEENNDDDEDALGKTSRGSHHHKRSQSSKNNNNKTTQNNNNTNNHHHHHQATTNAMLSHVVITDWLTAFDNDLRELEDHRTSREQRLQILSRMVATYSFCDGKLDQQ